MTKDSGIDPAARDKYLLHVTAGPTYDPSTQQEIPVNGSESTPIESDLVTCWLKIRIKDYHGLPHDSPSSSPYFEHALHTSDRYSIAFSFVPKQDLSGEDIVMGFDYDHSIRHQLPPGFKYAMKIATSMLDPGLYSDPYSDNPYLYGPALSGIFALNIGDRTEEIPAEQQLATLEQENSGVVEEGAHGSGQSIREQQAIPSKWKKRRKHFLNVEAMKNFTFEKGRMYHADFFNPYLDFANFSLRLPGFSISVARYIDEKTHHLRFVLKNRRTEELLFVVIFKLLFGEELEQTLEARKNDGETGGERHAQNTQHTLPAGDEQRPMQQETKDPPKASSMDVGKKPVGPDGSSREDEKAGQDGENSATPATTSLSNSIYAAFVAMGLWDDTSSSSDSEAPAQSSSARASGRSLESQVDDMDDATIEKYLQSRQSNV